MMDDPTKDAIPRSAVEYICRKETVSTNPDDFAHNEMFIRYLDHDAISSFGRWQWANGFNTALVAVKCGLDKIPTIEPERKKGTWMCYGEDGFPNESDVYFWQCDQCFKMQRGRRSTPMAFCPECGADMRGEQNETD